ncbi:MAG: VWA domain-containing protein [Polyangiales bacterium]
MLDARSPISRIALFAALFSTVAGCGASAKSAGGPRPTSPAYAGSGGGGGYAESTSTASGGGYSGSYSGGEGSSAKAEPASAPAADKGGYSAPSGGYAPPPAPVAAAPTPMTAPATKAPAGKKSGGADYAPAKPSAPPTGGSGSTAAGPVAMAPKPAPTTAAPPITIETKTTVTVTPTPYPPPGTYEQESPTGGILTAAIWDDGAFRLQFLSFLDRYPQFKSQWAIDMTKRVTIRVEDSAGVAVGDASIALRAPDGSIVNLRAHGDGQTYFWPTTSMLNYSQSQQSQGGTFSVAAQVGTLRSESYFATPTSDTTWTVKLKGVPNRAAQPALDIAFVVDTTGSMGDEISYLQNELAGVVKRVKSEHAMRRVRLGLVLYKDRGDEYVTKPFGFTEDLGTYLGWLKQAQAMGGGDMPESVNAALSDTVNKLDWAGDETGRLAILVGDAPPHYYADEQYTYKNAIVDLNARGVKLVSVGASGIDKSTEYVFRQMSAYTGGRYVFLTDDSGVGDSHLVPDITNYQVEHLDKILVRVIGDEARSFKR